jgi:hypothetical protein
MMRLGFRSAVLSVLSSALAAQEPAMPPREFVVGAIRASVPGAESRVAAGTALRARIRSYDGRILITRKTNSSLLAWLADTAQARTDPTMVSEFTVSFVSPTAVRIADAQGRCLMLTPNESSVPLNFGRCDRGPLWIYPGADSATVSGQSGFWLVSRFGLVGPTSGSPLMMPRSPLRVWFRLEPVQEQMQPRLP